jgi:glycosyltransferase involved in cell wall biosynthesis
MLRVHVWTIASLGSLARVRVMRRALHERLPETTLTVLLVDAAAEDVEPIPDAAICRIESVVGEDFGLIAAGNPPGALPMALLPFLLRAALEGGEPAVYIGASQLVVGTLGALRDSLAEREIVLVARPRAERGVTVAAPVPKGAISREMLGVRPGAASEALLGSWPRYFVDDRDNGDAAVRDWMDGIPALAEDVEVLRDPGYGLGAVAFDSRAMDAGALEVGDRLVLEGAPVESLDFGDLDPTRPLLWFGAASPVASGAAPGLLSIAERYAEELRSAGWSPDHELSPPFTLLEDGLRLTGTLRTLFVSAVLDGALSLSPFTRVGRDAFYALLSKPEKRGRAVGLTRLHMAIWDSRRDLQESYLHIDGPDGPGFAGWLCRYGAEQEGLVPELLPPAPDLSYRDADPHVSVDPPRWGVNVVGFFTAELGVGEASRLLIAGLDAQEIPALPIQGHLMPPSRQNSEFVHVRPDEAAYPINILCINGDGVPLFAREAGRSFFEGRYSIGWWWWEAGDPPTNWKPAYEFIDEVWVASQHIYDLLAPSSPVPVVRVRLPLTTPEVAPLGRAELGFPVDAFLFLCVHDYHSVAARKNPVAVIEAFRRAFPAGSGAKLVLKSINAQTRTAEHARVVRAATGHSDIILLDEYVTGAQKNAMIAAADCFVSLHRSEGFGIPAAEAMLLGKPVIATRYAGVLEFMNDENSYLVDWQPVAVGEGAYPYSPAATWAEPDIEHAAALMRQVFVAPAEAVERGTVARRQLLERHSPAVAGEIIKRRLSRVRERMIEAGQRSLNLAHVAPLEPGAHIRAMIDQAPPFMWTQGNLAGLQARLYHPVLEWVRAYTAHQGAIDVEIQEAVRRIDQRLAEIARVLQDQHNAHRAEMLAVLRGLNADRAKPDGSDTTS